MIMVSFRSKEDKKHLLEKAKKMEEYSSMIVDCLENSDYMDEEYNERRGGVRMRSHYDDMEEYPRYRRM